MVKYSNIAMPEISISGERLQVHTNNCTWDLAFQPCGLWTQTDQHSFICRAGEWEWAVSTDSAIRILCHHKGNVTPEKSPICFVIHENEKTPWRMLIQHPVFGCLQTGISKTNPDDDFFGAHDCPESSLFTLLYDRMKKKGVFAGFQVPALDDSLLTFKDGQLSCIFFQSAPAKAGITLDTLLLRFGSDPVELLARYADDMPQMRDSLKNKLMTGWNSWDYYFQTVTEEDIEENLAALKASPEIASRLEYIIIDDGWQNGYGDWEVSSRFHGHLESIVEKIHTAGYKAGIWVAPFVADYYSMLSLRHPEMLAKNKKGEYEFAPCGNGGTGTLDPTYPETEEMLKNLFSKLRKLGFEYFKVDFVRYLMTQSSFHHSSRRLDMVTHGMKIIREAIGPDAILTGCGMPVYGGHGIVNSMRVTGDISTYWSNVLLSARALSATFFLNRKVWINDPDFLIVRNPLTTVEKRYNPFFLPHLYQPFTSRTGEAIATLNETQVWCSMIILSGGNVIMSDRLSALNQTGKDLIRTVFQYVSAIPGIPLDLFEGAVPAKWVRRADDYTLFAFFNWEDSPQELACPLENRPCSGVDIWTKQTYDFPDGVFREVIPPRSVRMITINLAAAGSCILV